MNKVALLLPLLVALPLPVVDGKNQPQIAINGQSQLGPGSRCGIRYCESNKCKGDRSTCGTAKSCPIGNCIGKHPISDNNTRTCCCCLAASARKAPCKMCLERGAPLDADGLASGE